MTGLPQNIDDLLNRLAENSRDELDLVRTLADAIRRVDERMLRELRGMTIQHELRRESILGELQTLAARLCCLPANPVATVTRQTIEQHPISARTTEAETMHVNGNGADWRKAAQNIRDDLDFTFGEPPTH